MPFLTLRGYARHRGVSLTAVQKAIKDGRIKTSKKKGKVGIDSESADKAWDATTDPAKQRKEKDAGVATGGTFQQARAMREAYLANIAKLNYEEKIGKLVDADVVRKILFEAWRITRDNILNISNRLAPQLASETDPHQVHLLLEAEHNRALEELANALGSFKPSP